MTNKKFFFSKEYKPVILIAYLVATIISIIVIVAFWDLYQGNDLTIPVLLILPLLVFAGHLLNLVFIGAFIFIVVYIIKSIYRLFFQVK